MTSYHIRIKGNDGFVYETDLHAFNIDEALAKGIATASQLTIEQFVSIEVKLNA